MIHEVLAVGMLQMNCSVLGDEDSREAFVVDPGDEADRIMGLIRQHRLHVVRIVLTHAHLDHVGAVRELQKATRAPVSLHPSDQPMVRHIHAQAAMLGMPEPPGFTIDEDLANGDVLRLGGIEVHVLYTPGHTPGGCCLWIPSEQRLIAGDTLFRDSVGRTDLPGGDPGQLLESIRTQLLPLPDDAVVIPGHGPETTIGRERRFNPFLQGLEPPRASSAS